MEVGAVVVINSMIAQFLCKIIAADVIAKLSPVGIFSAREKPAMHIISHLLIAKPH